MNMNGYGAEDYESSDLGTLEDDFSPEDYLPPNVAYDLPVENIDPSIQTMNPENYVNQPQYAYQEEAPSTRAAGVTSDVFDLAKDVSTGELDVIAKSLEDFSKNQFSRFLDSTVVAPLLLFWAFRGKLTTVERALMGLVGAGYLISRGRKMAENKAVTKSPVFQQVKEQVENTLSGY